jgi:hypothetical protein
MKFAVQRMAVTVESCSWQNAPLTLHTAALNCNYDVSRVCLKTHLNGHQCRYLCARSSRVTSVSCDFF